MIKRNNRVTRVISYGLVTALINTCVLAGLTGEEAENRYRGIQAVAKPEPAFPVSLVQRGILTGQAVVVVSIDATGRLSDWLVIESSDRAFIKSISEVIEDWRFEPAYEDGVAFDCVQAIPMFFEARIVENGGSGAQTNRTMSHFLKPQIEHLPPVTGRSRPLKFAGIDELDAFPELVARAKPEMPKEVFERSLGSEARFEFYIDIKGRVRMPHLVAADGNADPFALVAAQVALEDWRFKPLTSKGKKVVFKAAQTIRFSHISMDGF